MKLLGKRIITQALYAIPTPLYMRFAGWQLEKRWFAVQLTHTSEGLLYVSVAPEAVCGQAGRSL